MFKMHPMPSDHTVMQWKLEIWCFVPLDPNTMKLVGTTIEEQTKRVLDNLSIVLAGVGLSLQNIVKTTVYLKNMSDFQGMNKIYEEMFQGHKPCRTTISIKQNPLDALVEIECIAELQT